ncbi:hypothetical protein D3C81_1079330 [compost metagenome]
MAHRCVRPGAGTCPAGVEVLQRLCQGPGKRRNAHFFRRRLTQLDELATARGEVGTQHPALLDAEADLLERVDAGGDEGLYPAALGGLQGLVIRPGLLPRREDGLQLLEQGIDHFGGAQVELLGRCLDFGRQVAGRGHDLRDASQLWLCAHKAPRSSAQLVSLKSGPLAWRFTGNGRTLLAVAMSRFTHLTSRLTHEACVSQRPEAE